MSVLSVQAEQPTPHVGAGSGIGAKYGSIGTLLRDRRAILRSFRGLDPHYLGLKRDRIGTISTVRVA